MSAVIDFVQVSTAGVESSPVADALAGLRANEARYFKNKYDHVFTTTPAAEATETVDWVARHRHRIPAPRSSRFRRRRHPLGPRLL